MSKSYVHNPLEGEKPQLVFNLEDCVGEAVSIVVVHKDRPEYLNLCLQSIAVNSRNNIYDLVVVDNNSDQESQSFLDEIENEIKVVRNKKNMYWSEAANLGAQESDQRSKYIIFMHADTVILNPSWIDLFVNVAEANQSGMIGLELGNYFMGNQKVDFVQEWCMLMTRAGFKKIGPWPTQLPMIGHSFIMTIKAQLAGLKPQVMKNNLAHHYKIFGLDVNDYERMTEDAYKLLPKIYHQTQTKSL
jgi:GT2 family glycosyltransferase